MSSRFEQLPSELHDTIGGYLDSTSLQALRSTSATMRGHIGNAPPSIENSYSVIKVIVGDHGETTKMKLLRNFRTLDSALRYVTYHKLKIFEDGRWREHNDMYIAEADMLLEGKVMVQYTSRFDNNREYILAIMEIPFMDF